MYHFTESQSVSRHFVEYRIDAYNHSSKNVGYCSAYSSIQRTVDTKLRPRVKRRCLFIDAVRVRLCERRRGIGRKLVHKMLHSYGKHYSIVRLYACPYGRKPRIPRTKLVAFYQSFGFVAHKTDSYGVYM